MEKQGMMSLHGVLLRYLVRTVVDCILAVVVWFLLLLVLIDSGRFLPARAAAEAAQDAVQNLLPEMTAATFDASRLDPLCRYVLFAGPDSEKVLATNMDTRHLQWALEVRQGKSRWHIGYTQYYMGAKLQDGSFCQLQFDYAVPYADPALRGKLPDIQTLHFALGIFLLLGVVGWNTHRTGKFLAKETEKLTEAARRVAHQKLDSNGFGHAKVKEYDAALQAMQTMGSELTDSLQRQWDMEQQQREQIMQLSHKLKTPLTIMGGNAELLAEDVHDPEQKRQAEAIVAAAEQTRIYLGKIRAEVQTPLKYKKTDRRTARNERAESYSE